MTRLISDCGQFQAERIPNEFGTKYRMFDASGEFLFETTWWSNRTTDTRIAFETGSGDVSATFGYVRYPKWFHRRWVLCFDVYIDELKAMAESVGADVLVAFKPDWNCWSHLGFRAKPSVAKALDQKLKEKGAEFYRTERKGKGLHSIECPMKAREPVERAVPA